MRPLLRAAAIGLIALVLPSCSIMDPDDRQALRDRLAGMAPNDVLWLRKGTMIGRAILHFEKEPTNNRVGKLLCREYVDGQWQDWREDQKKAWMVYDVLSCLREIPLMVGFLECKDQFLYEETVLKKNAIMEQQDPGKDVECRFEFDERYELPKLPEGIWKAESISLDDMIDFLITLPGPPPGFIAPELAPLLCPLGAGPGWGCPSDPYTETDPPPEGGG